MIPLKVLILLTGLFLLFKGIIRLYRLKFRNSIVKFNTDTSTFTVPKTGNYNIAIEGGNFREINEGNLQIIETNLNKNIQFKRLQLKNKFFDDGKSYSEIFQMSLLPSMNYKIVIEDYKNLKTHYSKYRINPKFTQNKPPKIIVIEDYPNSERLKSILFLLLGFLVSFLGYAILVLGNK